jgi:hypothetical protein
VFANGVFKWTRHLWAKCHKKRGENPLRIIGELSLRMSQIFGSIFSQNILATLRQKRLIYGVLDHLDRFRVLFETKGKIKQKKWE